MLLAAAVCPHPPLLIPRVAAGAAPELDDVRTHCATALKRVLDSGAERLVVVGAAAVAGDWPGDAAASFAGYGVPVNAGEGPPVLPLSLAVGAWLLAQAGQRADRYVALAADAEPADCAAIGRALADGPDRVALLVLGDGSACRSERAPGWLDPRAEGYDAAVAAALATADLAALAALDLGLATALQVAGRPAWQALAGAAAGGEWSSELLSADAPYGVGYFVAAWTRA